MIYQHAKNKKKKLKKQNPLISIDLIKNNQFKEICNTLEKHTDLTRQNRYIYGYALLRENNLIKAFCLWWPLANKEDNALRADCQALLTDIYQRDLLSQAQIKLDEETLKTIYSAARQLKPDNTETMKIRTRYLSVLWEKNDLVSLEAILKSQKETLSGLLIEDLSKVIFLQYHSKWLNYMPTLIGEVLTGATSLILRNHFYHKEVVNCLRAIANEIMYFYTSISKKKFSASASAPLSALLCEDYINLEIDVLSQIINLVLDEKTIIDIIPTSVFYHNHDLAHRKNNELLSWLENKCTTLSSFYHQDIYLAIQWICEFEKCFNEELIIKNILNEKYHPYLSLALMLKAAYVLQPIDQVIAKKVLKKIKQTEDEGSMLWKKFAQNILTSIISSGEFYNNPHVMNIIVDFYPFLNSPSIQRLLSCHINRQLQATDNTKKNTLEELKLLADAIGNSEQIEMIDVMITRQQTCKLFLAKLKKESERKKIKNAAKKTRAALLEHLTLIVDTCFLLKSDLTVYFFLYLEQLIKDNKINKLIDLECIIDYHCSCDTCKELFFRHDIPKLINEFSLPFIGLALQKNSQKDSNENNSKKILSYPQTLLTESNPFAILHASLSDTKAMILEKVMTGIQQTPANMAALRQAQNEVFIPAKRFIHEYFRYLSISNEIQVTENATQLSAHKNSQIPWREEVLNAL